jgi:hypothetical protein
MGEKKEPGKLRVLYIEVPENIHDTYRDKCEKHYGSKRQSNVPIRKFIHDFINGRIYIVDGVLHIREKK